MTTTATPAAGTAPAHQTAPALARPAGRAWIYPFGLYHAVSHSSDGLIPVLAIAVGAGGAMVALTDALGSIATAMGLLVAGGIADRLKNPRLVVVAAMGLAGLGALGLASAGTPLTVLAAAILWGFAFMGPAPAVSVYITRSFGSGAWTSQILRYQTVITVCAALGVAVSIMWLGAARSFWGETAGLRSYLILTATVAAAAALVSWRGLGMRGSPEHTQSRERLRQPTVYNDRLKTLLLVAAVLFMGLGMAGLAVPLYLVQELHAEGYKVMVATLAFMLVGALAVPVANRLMPRVLPLRLFSLAIFGRCLCLIPMGAAGILLPSLPAQGMVILLQAASGFFSAIAVASSSTRLVGLAPVRHQGAAAGHYSALTFVSMAVGALLAGLVSQQLGFFFTFSLAALLMFLASVLALRL